jgi:hypothetical protein
MSGDAKARVLKVTANDKNFVHIKFYTSYENETNAEVSRTPFLSLSAFTMSFYRTSSSPRIPYALSAWLEP